MRYADGYVMVVKKRNLPAYAALSKKAGKIWKEFGALEYCESAGDDLRIKYGIPFPKLAKIKPNETVVFSWIVYRSKADRDRINAKVMKDPRLARMMDPKKEPVFDMKRMSTGGFKIIVDM